MLVRVAQILATTAAACAAAVAVAPPAGAVQCYGTNDTAEACVYRENVHVDPTGGPRVEDCVYVTTDQCRTVGANLPSVTTTGPVAEVH